MSCHRSKKLGYFLSSVILTLTFLVIIFIISPLRISSNFFRTDSEETQKYFLNTSNGRFDVRESSVAVYATVQPNTSVTSKITENVEQQDTELRLFKPAITEEEREEFRVTLKSFDEAVKWNITYFLYGGSLLGSYRHHGMIPWDDDLDIFVNEKEKDILRKCLMTLDSEFELNTKMEYSWKFSNKKSFLTKRGWKWPFLDIFFYREDNTELWDIKPGIKRVYYDKKNVFPLIERPFMDLLLPAPKNTKVVLSQLFDLSKCQSNSYNHKKEDSISSKRVVEIPCDRLMKIFPFVKRTYTSNTTVETLEHDNSDTLSGKYNTTFILSN